MAIQVRVADATALQTDTATIPSTGVLAGDTVLLHVRTGSAITPVVGDGFALLAQILGTDSISVYQKTAGGSEPANYTVTATGSNLRLGLLALYPDVGSVLELDASASQTNSAATSYQCPSVTTTVVNTLLTCFVSTSLSLTTTAPGSMTKRYPTSGTSSISAFTESVAAAGATGTRSPTGSSASSRTVTAAWREVPAFGAPSNLVATAINHRLVRLTWDDNASTESGYEIERSPDGTTGWTVIASVAANVELYDDEDVMPATQYFYRVRGFQP